MARKKKPRPVRDPEEPSPLPPARPGSPPAGAPKGPGAGPSPADRSRPMGEHGERSEGAAPTPVRDLMREAGSARTEEPTAERSVIELDGTRWEVEVAGETRSGTAPDSGAPLLLLRFRREGGGADEKHEQREGWAVATSLGDIPPGRLAELLARSRPYGSESPG